MSTAVRRPRPVLEESVLSCVLLDPRAYWEVAQYLDGIAWSHPPHAVIWQAMTAIVVDGAQGGHLDPVTLRSELERRGQLEAAGGTLAIARLIDAVASPAGAVAYARQLAELARLERVAAEAKKIVAVIESSPPPVDAVRDAIVRLAECLDDRLADARPVGDDIVEVVDDLARGREARVLSPWPQLDRMLTGIRPGQLVVLAGRPGMGKTSFALQWLLDVASRGQGEAVLASLEMPRAAIQRRLLVSLSGLDIVQWTQLVARVTERRASPADQQAFDRGVDLLHRAARRLARTALIISDRADRLSAVRALVRRSRLRGGCALVAIDYLGKMQPPRRRESRVHELGDLTGGLKRLAVEENVPVLLLHQLSRATEGRNDRRPTLADLRDSGEIEQDADVVILLYRPGYYQPEAGDTMEVIVAKHRDGPTGVVRLRWAPTRMAAIDPEMPDDETR